jgi:hypothetical protein
MSEMNVKSVWKITSGTTFLLCVGTYFMQGSCYKMEGVNRQNNLVLVALRHTITSVLLCIQMQIINRETLYDTWSCVHISRK